MRRSVDEVVNYEDIYRLCYIRGPEGILIGLAQQLGQQTSRENPMERDPSALEVDSTGAPHSPESRLHGALDDRPRRRSTTVRIGSVTIGGGHPIAVQSMTNTETADAAATATQVAALAEAGSELVRVTVNTPEAAHAVPEIVRRVRDAGYATPIVGDFHFSGHLLLTEYPECARALDKYRINPETSAPAGATTSTSGGSSWRRSSTESRSGSG